MTQVVLYCNCWQADCSHFSYEARLMEPKSESGTEFTKVVKAGPNHLLCVVSPKRTESSEVPVFV